MALPFVPAFLAASRAKQDAAMKYDTILKKLPKGVRKAAGETGISPTTMSRLNRGYPPDARTIAKLLDWAGADSITLTRANLRKGRR